MGTWHGPVTLTYLSLWLSGDTGQGQSQLPLAFKSGLYSHGGVFCPGKGTCNQPLPGQDLVAEGSLAVTPGGSAAPLLDAPWAELCPSFSPFELDLALELCV